MTNAQMLETAMRQSAIDLGCEAADFLGGRNVVVSSTLGDGRKKYIRNAPFCHLVCYGDAMVASVDESIRPFVEALVRDKLGFRCLEEYLALAAVFEKHGKKIGTVEYFLPDAARPSRPAPNFDYSILWGDQVKALYSDDQYHMALGYDFRGNTARRDEIAVVGRSGGQIMGVAGASNDGEEMWQVGIDVMPEFRRAGVASALVGIITDEILRKGIVPYYGTPWSHTASKNVALSAGYRHAWVELYAYEA